VDFSLGGIFFHSIMSYFEHHLIIWNVVMFSSTPWDYQSKFYAKIIGMDTGGGSVLSSLIL
jgi:hypothetical protein